MAVTPPNRRLDQARSNRFTIPPITVHPTQLAIVISSAVLDASNYKWTYQIQLADLNAAATQVIAKANTPTYTAYSASELTNNASTVAWGIVRSQLPTGIVPVAIPNGTPVAVMAQKKQNGDFYYLILNSQAITGQCP